MAGADGEQPRSPLSPITPVNLRPRANILHQLKRDEPLTPLDLRGVKAAPSEAEQAETEPAAPAPIPVPQPVPKPESKRVNVTTAASQPVQPAAAAAPASTAGAALPPVSRAQSAVGICAFALDESVPLVAAACWAELQQRGADATHTGLFRVEGAADELEQMERDLSDSNQLPAEVLLIVRAASTDCVATMLKRTIATAAEHPLFSLDEVSQLEAAVDEEAAANVRDAMPEGRGDIVRFVTDAAARVASHEKKTRMGVRALATVLAPCLFRMPDSSEPMEMLQAARRSVQLTAKLLEGARHRLPPVEVAAPGSAHAEADAPGCEIGAFFPPPPPLLASGGLSPSPVPSECSLVAAAASDACGEPSVAGSAHDGCAECARDEVFAPLELDADGEGAWPELEEAASSSDSPEGLDAKGFVSAAEVALSQVMLLVEPAARPPPTPAAGSDGDGCGCADEESIGFHEGTPLSSSLSAASGPRSMPVPCSPAEQLLPRLSTASDEERQRGGAAGSTEQALEQLMRSMPTPELPTPEPSRAAAAVIEAIRAEGIEPDLLAMQSDEPGCTRAEEKLYALFARSMLTTPTPQRPPLGPFTIFEGGEEEEAEEGAGGLSRALQQAARGGGSACSDASPSTHSSSTEAASRDASPGAEAVALASPGGALGAAAARGEGGGGVRGGAPAYGRALWPAVTAVASLAVAAAGMACFSAPPMHAPQPAVQPLVREGEGPPIAQAVRTLHRLERASARAPVVDWHVEFAPPRRAPRSAGVLAAIASRYALADALQIGLDEVALPDVADPFGDAPPARGGASVSWAPEWSMQPRFNPLSALAQQRADAWLDRLGVHPAGGDGGEPHAH